MTAVPYLPLLFSVFWKSGVALGAALCINRLLRRKSADFRRLVLSTTIAVLFVAAAAFPILPRWTAVIPLRLGIQQHSQAPASYQPAPESLIVDGPELTAPSILPTRAHASARHIDFTDWTIPLIWSLGAAILLCRFAINLRGLRRLRAASERVPDSQVLQEAERYGRRVHLWQNNTIAAPVTWGIFRPVILVPTGFEALAADCREAVLRHEIAHIQSADFLMRSLAEIARAAIWFQR